eukprot:m.42656 g.42656  ORF g.42656 m.42656 type:complete len:189 (+) comp12123_c0_seq1:170-736(+)
MHAARLQEAAATTTGVAKHAPGQLLRRQLFSTSTAARDLYSILGVKRTATDTEIKDAYYRLSMQLHPDRNPNSPEAASRFTLVADAYAILGQRDRRRQYDAGHEPDHIAHTHGPRMRNQRREGKLDYATQFDFNEFYRKHYGEALAREQLRRRRMKEAQQQLSTQPTGSGLVIAVVTIGLAMFAFFRW